MMNRFNNLIYLLGFVVFLTSCSKDEENVAPGDDFENAQVGLFAEDARKIKVPDAMQQSSDPHAMAVSSYILNATVMPSLYSSLFIMPEEGAEKRSSPITASNGRMAASDYWVYEWGTDTASITYQFHDEGTQQYFELFIKDSKGYFKWMEIVQNADGKQGTMKWFDDTGESLLWTWEIRADESYFFTFHSIEDDYRYEIISNKDLSGSIKSYTEDNLDMEMEWDSVGNGSWKEYDGGSLVDEGTWVI